MTKCHLVALLILGLLLPMVATAQTPPYLTQWSAHGPGVAVGPGDTVYVADEVNNRIQKFTSAGGYCTEWGGVDPQAVAVDDSGNVYVTDGTSNGIKKFKSNGTYLTQWGGIGTGKGQFQHPLGVAVDDSGNVYVADTENYRIQKFTSSGTYLTQWGGIGTGNGQFKVPVGITVDASYRVYVADYESNRVQKFTSTGSYILQWGALSTPLHLAVDAGGRVYVTEYSAYRVSVFTSSGSFVCAWGDSGSAVGKFDGPECVAVDASGDVYVMDGHVMDSFGNNRVQKFGPVTVSVLGEAAHPFALDPVGPNPVVGGGLAVSFELAAATPARLELLDVRGRRIAAREVGAYGLGRHTLDLAKGQAIPSGIYLVRLVQGANMRVRRVAVLR